MRTPRQYRALAPTLLCVCGYFTHLTKTSHRQQGTTEEREGIGEEDIGQVDERKGVGEEDIGRVEEGEGMGEEDIGRVEE